MSETKLPMADAVLRGVNYRGLEAMLMSGSLTGLASNTKWNELISAVRAGADWRPSYRTKGINGFVSKWDAEWFYHLPFPFKYALWFDMGCTQAKGKALIDRSGDLVKLVQDIGFEWELRGDILRLFGYAPRDYEFLVDE